MARTQKGSSNPTAYFRHLDETHIQRQLQDFDAERESFKREYRKMEDDYMTEMTVKHPSQYRGHDYDKAIEKMDNR